MSEPLLIGVDLGTTGTRAVLYRADGTSVAQTAAATPLHRLGAGHVEQDPDDFVAAAIRAIRECVEQEEGAAARVAGLAISGQMAGVLGLGEDGSPSTPYDSWLDVRCADDVDELARLHGADLTAISGCPPMVNHAPKLRWWQRVHPDAFAATRKWIVPGGYVAARLAGLSPRDAFVDHTYLHFTGMADARATAWSPVLTEALGVPDHQLPRIVAPTTVIGGLKREHADACGLPAGTPIAAGLGDTAAATVGAGVVRPGQLLDVAGTASVLAGSTDRYAPDVDSRTLLVMHGAIDDQWIWLSFFSGGALLPWLAQTLGASDDGLDELLAEGAEAPAGSRGLVFVPHLDGRLLPSDPHMRGAWIGLEHEHRRPELVRSVLESVAYEYAGYLGVMRDLAPQYEPDELRAVGGGARSGLWNGIKASVLGLPVNTLARDELSCWGAALVAGRAVGVFDDLAAAAEGAASIASRQQPGPGDHDAYRSALPRYRDALVAASEVGRRRQSGSKPHTVTA